MPDRHDFVLGGFEEGDALLGRPTPPTLLGPPLRLKDRFAELCGERMTAATKAQSEASCRPSVAASRRAEVSQRWVWLTPALLLRKPRGSKTVDPEKPAALIKGCRGLRDPVIDAVRRRGRRGGSQAPPGVRDRISSSSTEQFRTELQREDSPEQRSPSKWPVMRTRLVAVEVDDDERVRMKDLVRAARRTGETSDTECQRC